MPIDEQLLQGQGGRVMYWDSASWVLAELAGILTEQSLKSRSAVDSRVIFKFFPHSCSRGIGENGDAALRLDKLFAYKEIK